MLFFDEYLVPENFYRTLKQRIAAPRRQPWPVHLERLYRGRALLFEDNCVVSHNATRQFIAD